MTDSETLAKLKGHPENQQKGPYRMARAKEYMACQADPTAECPYKQGTAWSQAWASGADMGAGEALVIFDDPEVEHVPDEVEGPFPRAVADVNYPEDVVIDDPMPEPGYADIESIDGTALADIDAEVVDADYLLDPLTGARGALERLRDAYMEEFKAARGRFDEDGLDGLHEAETVAGLIQKIEGLKPPGYKPPPPPEKLADQPAKPIPGMRTCRKCGAAMGPNDLTCARCGNYQPRGGRGDQRAETEEDDGHE